MDMNSDSGLLFEADNFDDDVFYEEIKRQILLLTTEEEEEEEEEKNVGFLEETKRRFNQTIICNHRGLNGSGYGERSRFCSWEAQNCDGSPPLWLINLWKNGKGTGVFIPQVVKCKKNQRSGT
ncbi:uncharacterized protein G2W53_035649 [Senna tora]|uniref:Uncharacterized protein n=1 Tax=Senna tora TaxID=362788 RepID=A0A834STG1_9FABA|nr:uncharacterized protein G2W53_035649 [Senna tora]